MLYRYIYTGLFAMYLAWYILDIFFSVLQIILSYVFSLLHLANTDFSLQASYEEDSSS